MKICCFIGHRKIEEKKELAQRLEKVVEDLILNENVSTFLFGSRSEFNTLSHFVVSKLKEKYPFIRRVIYTCRSESFVSESDKAKLEKILAKVSKQNIRLLEFEEQFEHINKYKAGKASYIERNRAMIDNSNFCVFYYDEKYVAPVKEKGVINFRPNSGTVIAFNYAKQKNKQIINLKNN